MHSWSPATAVRAWAVLTLGHRPEVGCNTFETSLTQIRDAFGEKKPFKSMTISSVLRSTFTTKVWIRVRGVDVFPHRELALFGCSCVAILRVEQLGLASVSSCATFCLLAGFLQMATLLWACYEQLREGMRCREILCSCWTSDVHWRMVLVVWRVAWLSAHASL